MLAEQPNVAGRADRDHGRLRRLIRVRQPSILAERERRNFVGAKTDQIEVEAEPLQFGNLNLEQRIIPTGVQRQLVIGQHISRAKAESW